jgi:hypothetical protein
MCVFLELKARISAILGHSESPCVGCSTPPLTTCLFTLTDASESGPRALKAVRQGMINADICRSEPWSLPVLRVDFVRECNEPFVYLLGLVSVRNSLEEPSCQKTQLPRLPTSVSQFT